MSAMLIQNTQTQTQETQTQARRKYTQIREIQKQTRHAETMQTLKKSPRAPPLPRLLLRHPRRDQYCATRRRCRVS
jgi:hypothetical protein